MLTKLGESPPGFARSLLSRFSFRAIFSVIVQFMLTFSAVYFSEAADLPYRRVLVR